MKQTTAIIKIFNFSHPLITTEVLSLLGDKYVSSLPFNWEFSKEYDQADIVMWDGIMTPKNNDIVEKILGDVKSGKMLILLGESQTLHKARPGIKTLNTENLNIVDLPGWSILPEELLAAIETCYKKLKHV